MNIQQGRIDTVQEIVTRGFNYLDQGHLDTAVALFTTVIELEPDRAVVYHYRGEAYYTQGAFDNAISDFSKAIAIDPNFAEAYSNRGLAYVAKGELDLAIQDYNTAIRLNPHETLAYYNRARFYSFGEEIALDLAIQDYNMAIKLDRDFVDAYQNRGLSYLMLEDFDRAVEDFDMAIKLNPNLDNAYKSRGLAYAFMGKFEHAVNDYSKAIELDPDDAETYRHRGKAWMHLNEWEKAAADLVTAGDIAEDVVDSLSVSDFESGDDLEDSGNIAERSTRQEATGDTPLPQSRYALPILTALEQFNGSAKTKDVLGKVCQLMENHIGDIDLSRRSDGQVYMENRSQAMRSELVRKGLMKDDSLHGIWEISDAGQAYLRTIDVQNAPQSRSLDTPLRERCVGSSNMPPVESQAIDTPLPRERYALPILNALVQFGGDATADAVLKKVRQLMEMELQQIDLSHRPDGQVYWKNRCHDMRRELIRRCLMKDDSPQGIWEVTHAGRESLSNNGSA